MTKKHDTAHSLAVQLLSPVGVPIQPRMLFSRRYRVVKELIYHWWYRKMVGKFEAMVLGIVFASRSRL